MDFKFTEEQVQFREEVKEFVTTEKEKGIFPFGNNCWMHLSSMEFSKEVAKNGLIGIAWPKEHGGRGMGYVDRVIMLEEMFRAGAPVAYHFMADRQVAPGIIHFGSDFLKKEFLSKIRNAEVCFCLLFSEPDAGSDLANCRTTAVEEGDYYIVNGQKVWTSNGHIADYGWALVKTNLDPAVSRYNAFSEMVIDMKSPGVTVRPLINSAGAHSFNEVYFDNVKVPKEYLVGTKDNGFRQIMTNLDFERAGIERLMQNSLTLDSLKDYVKTNDKGGKPLSQDPLIRDSIAKLEIEFEVGKLFIYYVASLLDKGKIPSYEAAMGKTFCTLYEAKLADVATTLMGLPGLLMPGSPEAPCNGMACEDYLWSPSYTLQGGVVEVLKNIVAQRGLKLGRKKK